MKPPESECISFATFILETVLLRMLLIVTSIYTGLALQELLSYLDSIHNTYTLGVPVMALEKVKCDCHRQRLLSIQVLQEQRQRI